MNRMDPRIEHEASKLCSGGNSSKSNRDYDPYKNYNTAESSWFWRYLPFWTRVKLLFNSMSSNPPSPSKEAFRTESHQQRSTVTRPTSLMTSHRQGEKYGRERQLNRDIIHSVIEEQDNIKQKFNKDNDNNRCDVFCDDNATEMYPIHTKEEKSREKQFVQTNSSVKSHVRNSKSIKKRELNLWSLRKSLEADTFYSGTINSSPNDFTPEGGGDCSPCSTSSSERLQSETLLTSDEDASIDEHCLSISTDRSHTPEFYSKSQTTATTTPQSVTHSVGSPDVNSASTSGIQSSGGSCSSGSAIIFSPQSKIKSKKLYRQKNIEDQKNPARAAESITSSSSLRNFTRYFRRPSLKAKQSPSLTFCGYSMERDYCVDVETDKIFKEYLRMDSIEAPLPPVTSRRLRRGKDDVTQLRRQVMKKQYSDSIAMYYGQRMRRWRATKQRSDSVNCPVDRGVLRRQAGIEEEFVPAEINERLLPQSSSRRGISRYDQISEDRGGFVFDDLQNMTSES